MRSWQNLAVAAIALLATHCAVSFHDYPAGDLDASNAGGNAGVAGTGASAAAGGGGGTGGAPTTGGTGGLATGGTGGVATGGTGGSSVGGSAGASDAGPTCVDSLSGVGTGDFRISFTITTTTSSSSVAIINQRDVCSNAMLWDIRMRSTGVLNVEVSDGTSFAQFFGTIAINDGLPHHVIVTRSAGLLAATVDGKASGSANSWADLGALPPLEQGTDPCVGDDGTVAFAGSLTDVCVEKLGSSDGGP